MIILGIDPGTKCGWALLDDGFRIGSGVWDLGSRRHEGGGMRFIRLRSYLSELYVDLFNDAKAIDAVAYEEVRRHMGVDAAHIYGGIVAVISEWCEGRPIPYRGIPVGTVKKVATGKGNASKAAMLEAAVKRFRYTPEDDNEADALFVGLTLWGELAPRKEKLRCLTQRSTNSKRSA